MWAVIVLKVIACLFIVYMGVISVDSLFKDKGEEVENIIIILVEILCIVAIIL